MRIFTTILIILCFNSAFAAEIVIKPKFPLENESGENYIVVPISYYQELVKRSEIPKPLELKFEINFNIDEEWISALYGFYKKDRSNKEFEKFTEFILRNNNDFINNLNILITQITTPRGTTDKVLYFSQAPNQSRITFNLDVTIPLVKDVITISSDENKALYISFLVSRVKPISSLDYHDEPFTLKIVPHSFKPNYRFIYEKGQYAFQDPQLEVTILEDTNVEVEIFDGKDNKVREKGKVFKEKFVFREKSEEENNIRLLALKLTPKFEKQFNFEQKFIDDETQYIAYEIHEYTNKSKFDQIIQTVRKPEKRDSVVTIASPNIAAIIIKLKEKYSTVYYNPEYGIALNLLRDSVIETVINDFNNAIENTEYKPIGGERTDKIRRFIIYNVEHENRKFLDPLKEGRQSGLDVIEYNGIFYDLLRAQAGATVYLPLEK